MVRNNKIKYFRILLIITGVFIWTNSTLAAASDVVINEIAWMGTDTSANDEWIELYSNTGQDIDLTGWTLIATDGSPNITLEGIIAANGYFLLERTDDNSVPNITADQIYTGALGNTGENLELKNDQNSIIDSVNHSDGWLAGDNSTKQTMEKIDNGWQTSLNARGTPKAINSSGVKISPDDNPPTEPDGGITIAPVPVNLPPLAMAGSDIVALVNQEIAFDAKESYDPNNDTLTYFWNFGDGATDIEKITKHTYLYPGQYLVSLLVSDDEFSDLDIIIVNIYSQSIIISEFDPNNGWIELYNQSDQVANLTNWQLNDFIFPLNSLIAPEQFLVLRKEITKITLNNDSDQVQLIYPDGSVSAEVNYLAENKEESCIAFDGSDYFWTEIPTPGAANIISNQLTNQVENLSSNNPQLVIEQTQELPEVLAQTSDFDTQDSTTSNSNLLTRLPPNTLQDTQPASLIQKNQSNQKNNLILYFSIIISASLLVSWVIIRIKNML